MTRHIWIVEANWGDGWEPYGDNVHFLRAKAEEDKREIKAVWPSLRFRVRKYAREGTC